MAGFGIKLAIGKLHNSSQHDLGEHFGSYSSRHSFRGFRDAFVAVVSGIPAQTVIAAGVKVQHVAGDGLPAYRDGRNGVTADGMQCRAPIHGGRTVAPD